MDEAVVKQGLLHLQLQQTFGKKWRKFWGILYRESPCSTARLELLEGTAPPPPDKLRRSEAARKLVKLSDCVHVAEAPGDTGGPKDTVPFLLETTDKCYLLAAEAAEAAEWIGRLCELAFPAAPGKDAQKAAPGEADSKFSMEENILYSSTGKGAVPREFEVAVRATASSERCRLRGRFVLRAEAEALELREPQAPQPLYRWPYRFLRRFGRDKATFSFEAGRRCASGEGSFEFETRQGNEIFEALEAAIEAQREPGAAAEPSKAPPPEVAKAKVPGGDVPCAEPGAALRRSGGTDGRGKGSAAEPAGAADAEYAVPFDAIAKSLAGSEFGAFLGAPAAGAGKAEHIYDEPEALHGHSVYDEPEQVRGDAWRLHAAPERPGAGDEYSVAFGAPARPWRRDAAYDNVALGTAKKRSPRE